MKRPVFVVGCPRSGTTLLYSMLLAAGGFSVYRKETYFYDLLPRFRALRSARARERFVEQYLSGYLGKVPGLDIATLVRDTLSRCPTSADFLPLLMTRITERQQMERWMEATPTHVLCMNDIRQLVPDAIFLHVIRDGRDCALSLEQQQWIGTLPWQKRRALGIAAIYWEWMVRSGREFGAGDASYMEVWFEELVARPAATLERIGRFIDHTLDYQRIRRHPLHSLKRPNTSYTAERDSPGFDPVGRWKDKCTAEQLRLCESVIGSYLEEIGYSRAIGDLTRREQARAAVLRKLYMKYFVLRQVLKRRTPLGRVLTNTSVWTEQPSPIEQPFFPVPVHTARETQV